MKRLITYFFISFNILCTVFGQSIYSDSLFAEGISCYENRKYKEAINYFLLCDSIDNLDYTISDERKGYSRMWIGSSYFKLGEEDNAIYYSPKYYKYPPVDRRKTIVSDSLSSVATSLFEEDRYQEALEILQMCAAIEKDSLGENTIWYMNTIKDCGYLCYNNEDYEGAIEYGELTRQIAYKVCGNNSEEYLESLYDLIGYCGDNNDIVKTKHYLKELELVENDLVFSDNEEYANALMELVSFYELLEDYDEAVRLITKANDVAEKDTETMDARNLYLFNDLIKLKHYDEAIAIGEEILKRDKKTIQSDTIFGGIFFSHLADCYENVGNYLEAINLCNKAIDYFNEVETAESIKLKVSTLEILSSCLYDLGQFENAAKNQQKVIDIMRSQTDYDSIKFAINLSNLAYYYSEMGNKVDAYITCEEAYNIIMKQAGYKDDPDMLLILSNLSSHYAELGNYSKAVELSKYVLSLRKQQNNINNFEYATSLNNLATFLSHTDNYDINEVISLQKESTEILELLYGKDSQHYITSLTNLASLYDKSGSPNMAIDVLNEALFWADSLYHKIDHPSQIHILYNIANVYNGLKQYDIALNYLKKAYSILNLYDLEDNFEYIDINKGLYYLSLRNNNTIEAKKWMNDVNNSIYKHVVENFPRLSSNERSLFWNLYSEWFYEDLPLVIPYDMSEETAETLYNSSLLFKGILLGTNILIDKLLEEEDPSLLHELQNLRQAQKLLEVVERNDIEMDVDSIIQNKDNIERNLLNKSQVYRGLQNYYKINYKDVKNALSERDLAIEFITLTSDSTEVYYALCLKNNYKAPHIIRLIDSVQINSISKDENYYSDSLSVLLWEPLLNELLDIENVYFSPIGELHKIGIEYASTMEKYNMYRVSSTRNVIDIKETETLEDVSGLTATLYGGIDYESQEIFSQETSLSLSLAKDLQYQLSMTQHRSFIDSLGIRGVGIKYLPGSLIEVRNIENTFKEKKYLVNIYTGSTATETTVKNLSSHAPNVLHIATHGIYYTESQLSRKPGLHFMKTFDQNNKTIEDKYLTRSCLMFAGANNTLNGGDLPMDADDGILTANEIAQLDLRGLDLVVLSACESGVGDIIQGEGVFGLQRGFKKAGAKSLLMSLWKISDLATEMLMTEFYNMLCEGKSKRESLRLAQKKVRDYKDSNGYQIFQDPFYWASFIMLD